ncbi:MAG: hypothetical protein RM368_37890 [Nostoc sp. DedSLP03]|nr:hypothetical protein [Nostoc sp. DedSLP03]
MNIDPVYKVSTQNVLKSNFILFTKITTSAIQKAMSDNIRDTITRELLEPVALHLRLLLVLNKFGKSKINSLENIRKTCAFR